MARLISVGLAHYLHSKWAKRGQKEKDNNCDVQKNKRKGSNDDEENDEDETKETP